MLSADDARLGAQADLLRVMQLQRVEVSRATAAFTVQVPVKRAATDASQQQWTARARAPVPEATVARTFPAGSYIVRMDQPYSRAADALLDYEYYSPNDPQKTPYDDTGWTFPELFATSAVRVTDPKVLDAPVELVKDTVRAIGGVSGSRTGVRDQSQRRQRARDAALSLQDAPISRSPKSRSAPAGRSSIAVRSSSASSRRTISTRPRRSSASAPSRSTRSRR